MNNEPNKPIEAEELTEKELEGVVGGNTMEKSYAIFATVGQKKSLEEIKAKLAK